MLKFWPTFGYKLDLSRFGISGWICLKRRSMKVGSLVSSLWKSGNKLNISRILASRGSIVQHTMSRLIAWNHCQWRTRVWQAHEDDNNTTWTWCTDATTLKIFFRSKCWRNLVCDAWDSSNFDPSLIQSSEIQSRKVNSVRWRHEAFGTTYWDLTIAPMLLPRLERTGDDSFGGARWFEP